MTTSAAEAQYLAAHMSEWFGKPYAVYNPFEQPVSDLPVIYGFNNGGNGFMYNGELISEDGYNLGSHTCSDEFYMYSDLGILEGSRPDRHEEFKKYYPEGYRMDFVKYNNVKNHEGLKDAMDIFVKRTAQETNKDD